MDFVIKIYAGLVLFAVILFFYLREKNLRKQEIKKNKQKSIKKVKKKISVKNIVYIIFLIIFIMIIPFMNKEIAIKAISGMILAGILGLISYFKSKKNL